jgi:chromosomal replication initiator protein
MGLFPAWAYSEVSMRQIVYRRSVHSANPAGKASPQLHNTPSSKNPQYGRKRPYLLAQPTSYLQAKNVTIPASKNEDGADMVDGVVDIPLPGRPLEFAAEQGDAVPPCHFLAGPENRLVEVAVRSVVEEQQNGYNPLVFYGPSGTGKSHLAHGLAAAWKARDRRLRVVCTSAVDFARELADAIETQGVDEFRAKHRGASLLVVEDLGMLASGKSGKLNAQEELIHTLDALVAENHWVVVTASVAPTALPGILPALQSRLTAGLTIPLAPPGLEARLAILEQLAAVRNIPLPTPVARVLAEGLIGTAPELAGSLLQFAVPSEFESVELNVDSAKKYIVHRGSRRPPTLHEIALATARHFSLRLSDLRSPVRRRALVVARGVAIYLARRLTNDSLEQIGSYFGGRDHSTVMHSCRKTEELLVNDPAVLEAVEQLQKTLWKT